MVWLGGCPVKMRGARSFFRMKTTTSLIAISNASKHPIALSGRTHIEVDSDFFEWLQNKKPGITFTAKLSKANRVCALKTWIDGRDGYLSTLAKSFYKQHPKANVHYFNGDVLTSIRSNLVFPADKIIRCDDELHVTTNCGALVKMTNREEALALVSVQHLSLNADGYVQVDFDGKKIHLQRLCSLWKGEIESLDDPRFIDHIHHDRLDNRDSEIRAVPRAANNANAKFKIGDRGDVNNVSWHTRDNKWQVKIQNGITRHFGSYEDVRLANLVARLCSLEWQGEHSPFVQNEAKSWYLKYRKAIVDSGEARLLLEAAKTANYQISRNRKKEAA